MQLIGRRTWFYAAFAIGSCVITGILILWPARGTEVSVDQDFYIAGASLLPLLLLAQLIRLTTIRDHSFRDLGRLREILRDTREIEQGLAETPGEPSPPTRSDEAVQEMRELRKEIVKLSQGIGSNVELFSGALIATLLLFSVGIASVLTALARGGGTKLTFVLTALPIGWMVITLVIFELLNFLRNPNLDLSAEQRRKQVKFSID